MRGVVLVLLFVAVYGQNLNDLRSLISRRTTSTTPASRALTPCTQTGREDCEDCTTVKICSYDKTPLTSYRCQDADPTKPFCTGAGICSDMPPAGVECGKVNDLCPGPAGYYPDPTNCTRYLYCDDAMKGYEQSCVGVNNVYNQTTASCFLKRRTTDCFQVDCNYSRNKNQWFVYTPSPQLYFFCSENGAITFQCPSATDVFNVDLKKCEFQCREAGRFPHPKPTMYYECAYVTTSKLQKYELTCPSFLEFNSTISQCAPKATQQSPTTVLYSF